MVINRKIVKTKGIKAFYCPPLEFFSKNKDIIFKQTKQFCYILSENFEKIVYCSKLGNGTITLEKWLKKFRYNPSQVKELERCYGAFQKFEDIKESQIQLFLDRGLTTKFLERLYFLRTIRGSGSLPYLIVQFGITNGFERYKNNFFKVNNPGKKHNGILSPFSKNFLKYKNLTASERDETIKSLKEKRNFTVKLHPENQNTRLEYFIKLYGDTEFAREKYRERQATRSLENYIRIYGEELGPVRFKETIDRWLNTLNSKPQKEKDRINRLKASHINPQHFKYDFNTQRGMCYYLKFTNVKDNSSFFKIGITSKTIRERFWKPGVVKDNIKFEIIQIFEGLLLDCWIKEQSILANFNKDRVNVPYPIVKTTEAFSRNVLGESKIENY